MTKEQIVILVLAILLVVALLTLAFVISYYRKKLKESNKAQNIKVKDGVRYTENANEVKENGDISVTHQRGDIILECGVTYTVMKKGLIIPGKYTILSDRDNVKKFNIRMDGFVREYEHQTDVVLAEGTTITPVSHSVILR